jgi:hypothetical protein
VVVALLALAALTLAPRTSTGETSKTSGVATMKRGAWLAPDQTHVIAGDTITTLPYPSMAVTNLPASADIKDDVSMTFAVTLDTSTGTRVPFVFRERSGILTITPLPEDVKDQVVQPSAIDGTTATVRIKVTAHGARLALIQKVYYEAVQVWLPGQKKHAAALQWTWKPAGQHDQP